MSAERSFTIFLAALALGATACGSSSKGASTTPSTSAPAAIGAGSVTTVDSGAATTTTAAAATSTGHVGDTLTHPDQFLASDVETVALVKVIDPVTPKVASNTPDTGKRWIGLDMTFSDSGDNVNNRSVEALATGSDGTEYTINADIEGAFTECTPTTGDVAVNHKVTFCPGFLVPTGVTITKVGYSLRGSSSGTPSELTWTVP